MMIASVKALLEELDSLTGLGTWSRADASAYWQSIGAARLARKREGLSTSLSSQAPMVTIDIASRRPDELSSGHAPA